MGKLIILSGPSCIGKSPLDKALKRFYSELRQELQTLVLYNNRTPRPGETDGVDYHFRSKDQIEALRNKKGFVVMDVRGDLQALDLAELRKQLARGDVFYEGNPFIGKVLLTDKALKAIEKVSVFISPLSISEIIFLKDPKLNINLQDLVTDIMKRKLLRRTRKQKGELSFKDLENIERRAGSAYTELMEAHLFDWVLPNYDGEDSENWDAFYYPIGSAGKTFNGFVEILTSGATDLGEHWPPDLIT